MPAHWHRLEAWHAHALPAFVALVCVLGLGFGDVTRAFAADGNHAAYEQAIESALARYRARDWAGARAAFEQAHALEPSARTLRGLALSALYAGDDLAAARAFEQALADDRRPLSEEQRSQAERLLAEALRRIAQVTIRAEPAGAAIALDQQSVENDARTLLLPGRHHLEVTLADCVPHAEDFEMVAGQQLSLRVELSPIVRGAPAPVVWPIFRGASPRAEPARAANARRAVSAPSAPWIAAGATLAVAAVAAGFALAANHELHFLKDECRRQGCTAQNRDALWADSPIRTYQTAANVAMVASAAGAVTTAAMFVFAYRGVKEPAVTLHAAGSGLMVRGSF